MRRTVYHIARVSGALSLSRRFRAGAVVLCYHNVLPSNHGVADPALHIPVARFTEQMDWLAAHFQVIPLSELARLATMGRPLRGLAALTFDDAYEGTLGHGLPVLAARQLPATIFVPTAYPDHGQAFWWDHPSAAAAVHDPVLRSRWLEELDGDGTRILEGEPSATLPADQRSARWDALAAQRSDLVTLESHSVTHRSLPRLSDVDLREELQASADRLEAQLGSRPRWIAYPYGRWDARVARAAAAAGYRGGWTLDGADVTATTDWHAAPRINIPASLSLDSFAAWVSGLAHWRSRRRS